MVLLQFMQAGRKKVAVPSIVHSDHLIEAKLALMLTCLLQMKKPKYILLKISFQ